MAVTEGVTGESGSESEGGGDDGVVRWEHGLRRKAGEVVRVQLNQEKLTRRRSLSGADGSYTPPRIQVLLLRATGVYRGSGLIDSDSLPPTTRTD